MLAEWTHILVAVSSTKLSLLARFALRRPDFQTVNTVWNPNLYVLQFHISIIEMILDIVLEDFWRRAAPRVDSRHGRREILLASVEMGSSNAEL